MGREGELVVGVGEVGNGGREVGDAGGAGGEDGAGQVDRAGAGRGNGRRLPILSRKQVLRIVYE
jgi:hypothetical protein